MFSAVLAKVGFTGTALVLVGGLFLGMWSAISPAIGQKYTDLVTDDDGIAMGHFGSLGYYVAAFIGEKIGNPEDSTENIKIPEKLNFLRDTTISTGITMLVFYIVGAFVNGLFLSFLPALLLPVLGGIGFQNTTFGDVDFGVLGIIVGKVGEVYKAPGIIAIIVLLAIFIIVPSIVKKDVKVINAKDEY